MIWDVDDGGGSRWGVLLHGDARIMCPNGVVVTGLASVGMLLVTENSCLNIFVEGREETWYGNGEWWRMVEPWGWSSV